MVLAGFARQELAPLREFKSLGIRLICLHSHIKSYILPNFLNMSSLLGETEPLSPLYYYSESLGALFH